MRPLQALLRRTGKIILIKVKADMQCGDHIINTHIYPLEAAINSLSMLYV